MHVNILNSRGKIVPLPCTLVALFAVAQGRAFWERNVLMKILGILVAMTFRNKHDLTQEQNKSLTLSSLSGHTELDLDMCVVLDLCTSVISCKMNSLRKLDQLQLSHYWSILTVIKTNHLPGSVNSNTVGQAEQCRHTEVQNSSFGRDNQRSSSPSV